MDWATFVWVLMPFGLKNALATNQKAMNKAFKDYVADFMKLFLDDFMILVIWIPIYSNYENALRNVGSMG
jgi:hypothetical protein